MMPVTAPILEVESLKKGFGGVQAVDGVSFTIREGETVGIIGPNGAGKTTVFNLITGFYRPDGGTIRFRGQDIVKMEPYRLPRIGIARTFQNLRLFGKLTVFENVLAAALSRKKYGFFAGIFRTGSYQSVENDVERHVRELLDFFLLTGKENFAAESLPYGEQRLLEMARALATGPDLLLIDEPGAGMNPMEIQNLVGTLKKMKEAFSLTIALIEHQMGLVMNVSERVIVVDFGKKIAEGTPEEVKRNRQVIEAYLGEDFSC